MKPFLGIDLSTDKNNERFNANAFLVRVPSAALSKSLETATDKATATIEQAKLPLPLRIVQYICGFAALIIVGAIFKADVSLAEGYQNAPWIFWTAGICLIVWLLLNRLGAQKAKIILDTEESTQTLSSLDGISDAIYADLTVPADAKEVDILSFFYKEKNGNIKVCEKGMQLARYFNPIFKVFSDSENLYLANLEGKYAFPLPSIAAIRTVKKHICIAEWNKDVPYNKGIYTQYKLTTDQYDRIHCKYYHILEVHHNGEVWGIYIPCYELPIFEELTGLKAPQM